VLHPHPEPVPSHLGLAALLPKLHLNQHTPHAILFASTHFGGLQLPELYTDKGVGQLKLFFGHLKLQDDTGNLLLVLLSELQLHIGTAHPILSAPYAPYAKLTDQNWLTSLRKFLSVARMQFDIEHLWWLDVTREHDHLLKPGPTPAN
jgi:hypothetical protein